MHGSITKRWIKGSLVIIISVMVVAEILAVAFVKKSYYSAATIAILSRVNTINGTLSASKDMSVAERNQLLYTISEQFTEKDKFEIMFISDDGQILSTSTGFLPSDENHIEDVMAARQSEDKTSTGIHMTKMGEKVLTATLIIQPKINNIYALRFVTSLNRVDEQIQTIRSLALLAFTMVVVFSVISGLYFVRSIVGPVREIEAGAALISHGNFNVRVNTDYNDEIGQLRETINNMAEELGKIDDMKNEFISSVSHELRTPLTAIKGWAETLAASPEDSDTIIRGTKVILSETDRLYSMVENLLDFSRLQQSDLKFTKERIDILAEVSDSVIMFTPRCEKAGIELTFDEPDYIIPVYADKARIKQVLVNLLDNAVKYTPRGGKINVGVKWDRLRRLVCISVLDNGCGILPEDLEKVTQKFYKGKGAKRGSGIGLALVKEIVEAHGGNFKVESEYGKWTKMTFCLHTVKSMKG